MSELERSELAELAAHEAVIERGLETFYEVGMALLKIRNGRLYRVHHTTFKEYCEQRWRWSEAYVNRQIAAAECMESLTPIGVKPKAESQTRPLVALEPEQQREAWSAAVAQSSNGQPTAREVAEVVRTQFTEPPQGPTQAEIDAKRRAREAEARAEELLKERDDVRIRRYMLYSGLIEAVQKIADFHIESVAEAWDGIWSARGAEDFMENLDKAQRCLSRLKLEHPNAVRKPGIILQKPS